MYDKNKRAWALAIRKKLVTNYGSMDIFSMLENQLRVLEKI